MERKWTPLILTMQPINWTRTTQLGQLTQNKTSRAKFLGLTNSMVENQKHRIVSYLASLVHVDPSMFLAYIWQLNPNVTIMAPKIIQDTVNN